MIIIYTNRRSKGSLSTVLNYINNNASRELTYTTSDTFNKHKVDVNIIMDAGFEKDDVEMASEFTDNDTVCMCVLPDSISKYRSGEYISIAELEKFIEEM